MAVGDGLDLTAHDPQFRARAILDAQPQLAKRYDLPVMSRTRGARMTNWRDAILKRRDPSRTGVVHDFAVAVRNSRTLLCDWAM